MKKRSAQLARPKATGAITRSVVKSPLEQEETEAWQVLDAE